MPELAPALPAAIRALARRVLASAWVPLWWRRGHPAAVLVGSFVVTTTYLGLPYPDGPVYGPLIVGLINAVTVGRRVTAYAVIVAAILTSLLSPMLLG